jgi:hypothetical protein
VKTKTLALSAVLIAAVATAGSAQDGQSPFPVMQAGGPPSLLMELGYDDYVGPSQASPQQVLPAGGLAALDAYPATDDAYGVMQVAFRRHAACESCGGSGCDSCRGDGHCDDGGCSDCGGGGCQHCRGSGRRSGRGWGGACDPLWRVRGEALWIDRDTPRAGFVFSGLGVAPDLNTDSLDFDAELGYRAAVERSLGCGTVEVVYFQVADELNTRFDAFGSVPLPGGGNFTMFHEMIYESTLYNGEINLWRPLPFGFKRLQASWMPGGFRHVNIGEDFVYNAIFPDERPTLGIPPGGPISSLSSVIQTRNQLYGYQIGLWTMLPLTPYLGASFEGKAGVFGNSAEQETETAFFRGDGTTIVAAAEHEVEGQEAFVGEINVAGTYRVNDNVSIYAAWQALWVSGLALAPEHADRTAGVFFTGPVLRTDGSVFYNILRAGVDVMW